jgi:hypothetical protein
MSVISDILYGGVPSDSLLDIFPNEIIYSITQFTISGVDRVLSACYRIVCKTFSILIKPVRKQYVMLNLAAIKHKNVIELMYAYRFNPQLCEMVLTRYYLRKKFVEYLEIKEKIRKYNLMTFYKRGSTLGN